jgi:hypothetical protein
LKRPMLWCRADDVRALLFTCLVPTLRKQRAETLEFILDVYTDQSRRISDAATPDEVTRVLATSFTSVWRRSLVFHLAQAAVSFRCFQEIGELLRRRPCFSDSRTAGGTRRPPPPPISRTRASR